MTFDDELEIKVRIVEIRTHAIVTANVGRVRAEATFEAELTQVCVAWRR